MKPAHLSGAFGLMNIEQIYNIAADVAHTLFDGIEDRLP